MIRTRELVVFLSCCLFLLGAIALTLSFDTTSAPAGQAASVSSVAFADPDDPTVSDGDEESADNTTTLASMRERIRSFRATGGVDSDQFVMADRVAVETEEAAATTSAADSVTESVRQCTDYAPYTGSWPRGVLVDEREGARIVYVPDDEVGAGSATNTPSGGIEDVLLQLPVQTTPRLGTSCVGSDVVGVAQDGSLIRNGEADIYGIFTDSTVVGYALDGFPIYGQNDSIPTDECGGAMLGGQYGYVLQSDRDVVVHCFSGTPAQL